MSSTTQSVPTGGMRRRALVIGGSIAGLLASRVLSDHYDDVVVVERDVFPEEPIHRNGVPQSHHAHGLLARGDAIIETLFSGIQESMWAGGALRGDAGDVLWVTPAGMLLRQKLGKEGVYASRALLEWHVRERLAALPGVRLMPSTDVTGITTTPDAGRITGVTVRLRGSAGPAPETLSADLVVDASGRHSSAPRWLEDLGYGIPPESTINSGLGYASRVYRKPAGFSGNWEGLIIQACPPHNPRMGALLPIENDQWHVTLGGVAGHYPPTAKAAFLDWARALPDLALYHAIREAEPLTRIRGYRTPTNRLRGFDRLGRWPRGLIVLGDAVGAFNPIYGQGMTVSALGALALDDLLRRHDASDAWEHRFQKKLAKTIRPAWQMATSEDLRWPEIRLDAAPADRATRLMHRYVDRLVERACTDPVVSRTYLEAIHMLTPASALLKPGILLRVFGRVDRLPSVAKHGTLKTLHAARKPLARMRQRKALTGASADD